MGLPGAELAGECMLQSGCSLICQTAPSIGHGFALRQLRPDTGLWVPIIPGTAEIIARIKRRNIAQSLPLRPGVPLRWAKSRVFCCTATLTTPCPGAAGRAPRHRKGRLGRPLFALFSCAALALYRVSALWLLTQKYPRLAVRKPGSAARPPPAPHRPETASARGARPRA